MREPDVVLVYCGECEKFIAHEDAHDCELTQEQKWERVALRRGKRAELEAERKWGK